MTGASCDMISSGDIVVEIVVGREINWKTQWQKLHRRRIWGSLGQNGTVGWTWRYVHDIEFYLQQVSVITLLWEEQKMFQLSNFIVWVNDFLPSWSGACWRLPINDESQCPADILRVIRCSETQFSDNFLMRQWSKSRQKIACIWMGKMEHTKYIVKLRFIWCSHLDSLCPIALP